MGDAALDQLVLEYLKKRSLVQAHRVFKEEAQVDSTDMSLKGGTTDFVENLLFYLVADSEPDQYAVAFDALAAWVDNALDIYQVELMRLLYPLFIHTYLQLVARDATEAALQLMSKHKRRFTVATGVNSRTRLQELDELQTVAAPEHLKTHRIAQTVHSNRFPIRLSRFSCELLTNFVTSAKPLSLLLSIIHDHLQIQIIEGQPSGPDQEQPEALELLSGHVPEDTIVKNQQPLNLSLLQGSVELKWAQLHAASDRAADANDQPQPKKHKKTKDDKAKKGDDKATADGMAPQIPVVPLHDKLEASLLEGTSHRATLHEKALPSAMFFTFLNTHQTLTCMSFSLDGSYVAGGFADSSVRVYSVDGGSAQQDGQAGPGPAAALLRGHSGSVFATDFMLEQQLLLSASADGTVRLWSTELAAGLAAFRGHNVAVWDVAASPIGQYFASASADRTARVWVTDRALPLRLLAGHYTDVDVVRWHPSGHLIATGSSDRTVRLWDIRDGQSRRTLAGHKAPVTSLALSPDGKLAASGDEAGAVIVWDLAQAKKLESGKGHAAAVWSLAFSRGNGAVLASGGADNTVRLWTQTSAKVGTGANTSQQAGGYTVSKTLRTKATPVFGISYTIRNLLLAGGCMVPPSTAGRKV